MNGSLLSRGFSVEKFRDILAERKITRNGYVLYKDKSWQFCLQCLLCHTIHGSSMVKSLQFFFGLCLGCWNLSKSTVSCNSLLNRATISIQILPRVASFHVILNFSNHGKRTRCKTWHVSFAVQKLFLSYTS